MKGQPLPETSYFLSVIIPAYNEEARIIPTLEKVEAYLAHQPYAAEVIVVDDGSSDNTAAVVAAFAESRPAFRLLRARHRGKGHAVKRGMLAASGRYRFLCDADLAMPIEQLGRFLPPAANSYDVAIGSREAAGARRFHEPRYRHLMGRIFNLLVRLVAVRGLSDTQCGFKCFKEEAALALFSRQTVDGFGFDVEVLYLAQKLGYRVIEVPIDWYHSPSSRVRPGRDALAMLRDALAVRWRDLRRAYDSDEG